MGRPVNHAMKNRIKRAAWAQFAERGYDKTSYTSIAQACGVTRNLVQYHFPKKEQLAIDFMQRLLELCEEALASGSRDSADSSDLAERCREAFDIGCCYYAALINGYRRFLLEIIVSRELTSKILAFNEKWTVEHFGLNDEKPGAHFEITRDVIISTGGFYELLYYCLSNGEPFDVPDNLAYAMKPIAVRFGVPPAEAEHLFEGRTRGIDAAVTLKVGC